MKSSYIQSAFVASIICICAVKSESNAKYRIVKTNNGKVRGIRATTLIKKCDYFAFKGIPYAKSPTAELRFKVSVAIGRDVFVS